MSSCVRGKDIWEERKTLKWGCQTCCLCTVPSEGLHNLNLTRGHQATSGAQKSTCVQDIELHLGQKDQDYLWTRNNPIYLPWFVWVSFIIPSKDHTSFPGPSHRHSERILAISRGYRRQVGTDEWVNDEGGARCPGVMVHVTSAWPPTQRRGCPGITGTQTPVIH